MIVGSVGISLNLFTHQLYVGMIGYPFGDLTGKELPVHSQRAAGWQRRRSSGFQEHGAQHPGFVFEQPGGPVRQVGAQRVGTDQLSQVLGFVSARLEPGTHFV